MSRRRQSDKAKKFQANRVKKRIQNIEEGPTPDYRDNINNLEYWTEIEIKQHSPFGIKKSSIIAFMAHDRVDSSIVKVDRLFLFRDSGRGLLRMGNHRLMAWIAKHILTRYGRFEYENFRFF